MKNENYKIYDINYYDRIFSFKYKDIYVSFNEYLLYKDEVERFMSFNSLDMTDIEGHLIFTKEEFNVKEFEEAESDEIKNQEYFKKSCDICENLSIKDLMHIKNIILEVI